jgi:hypothetical protein
MGLHVGGIEKFVALARKLQEVDDKKLKGRFYRAINSISKPLISLVRDSAANTLPKRGGLAKRVADAKYRAFRQYRGSAAGVQIIGTDQYDLRQINQGTVRHLVYGHPPIVAQKVKPLFFDEPIIENASLAREALEKEMDDIARELDS